MAHETDLCSTCARTDMGKRRGTSWDETTTDHDLEIIDTLIMIFPETSVQPLTCAVARFLKNLEESWRNPVDM